MPCRRAWCSTSGPSVRKACWATPMWPTTPKALPSRPMRWKTARPLPWKPSTGRSSTALTPGLLETAAMIGVAGTGVAVLGYTGYMIGTELYLNTVLPAGAAIPNNAGELALLLGSRRDPGPRCSSPCRCCPGPAGPCMGHREPAPRPGCVCGGFRQPLGGYSELESAEGISGEPSQSKLWLCQLPEGGAKGNPRYSSIYPL